MLVSAAGGYGLRTDELELDVRELDALLGRARELDLGGRAEHAVAALEKALALWHGECFHDVRAEPWARAEITRLEEWQAAAVEQRAGLLLALGRPAQVVAALEVFLGTYPLRERAWELLVRAYVAQGRQADALDRLRLVRGRLAQDLGVDPGPELRGLETAVLRQAVEAPSIPHAQPPTQRFVGRAIELATLEQARRDALTGSEVVLVSGEPGVGKSTLLAHFAATKSIWGRYPDHAIPPPLWGWEQVFRWACGCGRG